MFSRDELALTNAVVVIQKGRVLVERYARREWSLRIGRPSPHGLDCTAVVSVVDPQLIIRHISIAIGLRPPTGAP